MALPEDQSNWPIDAPAETESFNDNMLVGGYNPDASVQGKKQRKFTLLQLRLFFSTVLVFLNGIRFNSNRIAMQELTLGTLTVSGWYKVVVSDTTAFSNYSGIISFSDFASKISGLMAVFSGCSSNSALAERHIEILSKYNWNSSSISVTSIRLGVSNVETSGAVIELELDIPAGNSVLTSQIMGNLASSTLTGMSLITPVISDGKCPDGITAATYIEAGKELISDSIQTIFTPKIAFRKTSNDVVRLTFQWDDIPKQGTVLTMGYTSFTLHDLSGVSVAFTGAEVLGAISITRKEVVVSATRVAAFTTLTGGGMVELLALNAVIS